MYSALWTVLPSQCFLFHYFHYLELFCPLEAFLTIQLINWSHLFFLACSLSSLLAFMIACATVQTGKESWYIPPRFYAKLLTRGIEKGDELPCIGSSCQCEIIFFFFRSTHSAFVPSQVNKLTGLSCWG